MAEETELRVFLPKLVRYQLFLLERAELSYEVDRLDKIAGVFVPFACFAKVIKALHITSWERKWRKDDEGKTVVFLDFKAQDPIPKNKRLSISFGKWPLNGLRKEVRELVHEYFAGLIPREVHVRYDGDYYQNPSYAHPFTIHFYSTAHHRNTEEDRPKTAWGISCQKHLRIRQAARIGFLIRSEEGDVLAELTDRRNLYILYSLSDCDSSKEEELAWLKHIFSATTTLLRKRYSFREGRCKLKEDYADQREEERIAFVEYMKKVCRQQLLKVQGSIENRQTKFEKRLAKGMRLIGKVQGLKTSIATTEAAQSQKINILQQNFATMCAQEGYSYFCAFSKWILAQSNPVLIRDRRDNKLRNLGNYTISVVPGKATGWLRIIRCQGSILIPELNQALQHPYVSSDGIPSLRELEDSIVACLIKADYPKVFAGIWDFLCNIDVNFSPGHYINYWPEAVQTESGKELYHV